MHDKPQRKEPGEAVNARPNFCLLGADYENTNLGIKALTTGALFAIDARYPNTKVRILDYRPSPREFVFDLPSGSTRVELLNIRFSKKLWLHNHIARLVATAFLLTLVPSRSLREKLASRNPWMRGLMEADSVLALNYGDSFSDIYGFRRFIYVSLPQVLAILLRRPLVQLPQTIGPFRSRFCTALGRWILSRSAMIYSRDEQAVGKIRMLIPKSRAGRVKFCPDLGFVVPARKLVRDDSAIEVMFSRRPVVGFNVSGLLYIGGYTGKNMFGLASDYKALVGKVIDYFIRARGATVVLVPHVVAAAGQGEVDTLACDELIRDLQHVYPGRLFTLPLPYDERDVKDVIARCDFFVGARMHACIAALSQYVPAAAMAYSGKFVGVLESVGMRQAVVDLRALSSDEVLAALGSLFDSREELKQSLQTKVEAAQRAILSLFDGGGCNGGGLLADAATRR